MALSGEAARLSALRQLNVLDSAEEDRFDRVVRLAQSLFDVPMVAVSLIDHDRQWLKASVGLAGRESPRLDAFCDHTIRDTGPMVVTDALTDERFRGNPLVVDAPRIRFYAGQPLRAPGGARVGALCIIDDKPRPIGATELDLLRDLADWVEKELATDQELQRAREVQSALHPRRIPDVPGYDIAGECVSAQELGGDFHDWLPVGDQFQVVLGDVMGKGVPAALIAASVRAVVRVASQFNALEDTINRSAAGLEADLDDTGTFVTLFAARIDPPSGIATYVDAGHGLALVISPDGGVRRLVSDGLPLGATPGGLWHAYAVHLQPGDTLLAVSDGFLDFFPGPDDAVRAAVGVCLGSDSAQEMVDTMATFARRQLPLDDVTVVVVRRSAR